MSGERYIHPSVAMLLVHPVSGGQFACAVRGLVFRFHLSVRSCTADVATLSVVTDSPPETGGSPRRGRGWIVFSFPFSPFRLSHATRCGKGGGDSREDGDYYVEYFTPESVVVECSHSG